MEPGMYQNIITNTCFITKRVATRSS